jgi:hypothetical protein
MVISKHNAAEQSGKFGGVTFLFLRNNDDWLNAIRFL